MLSIIIVIYISIIQRFAWKTNPFKAYQINFLCSNKNIKSIINDYEVQNIRRAITGKYKQNNLQGDPYKIIMRK